MENKIKKVKQLYELMLEENLERLELKGKDVYIKLKRKTTKTQKVPDIEKFSQQSMILPEEKETTKIKSSLNGIFYRAPSSNSKPFVDEGDIVEAGRTLCIIEAMKVMNEIRSEFKCKIFKIFVENGKPVSAGQEIFSVLKMG